MNMPQTYFCDVPIAPTWGSDLYSFPLDLLVTRVLDYENLECPISNTSVTRDGVIHQACLTRFHKECLRQMSDQQNVCTPEVTGNLNNPSMVPVTSDRDDSSQGTIKTEQQNFEGHQAFVPCPQCKEVMVSPSFTSHLLGTVVRRYNKIN